MTLEEVQKTINYSRFFKTPLTLKDLHLWLISPHRYSLKVVSGFVFQNPSLQKKLTFKTNIKKIQLSQKKIKSIQKLLSVIKMIPSIKLIALTGSLSVYNPKKKDDIDLMIITSPNTLWLTRPLVVLLTSLLSSRRTPNTLVTNNQVCTNLWLDQTSLTIPREKQNLYTAHEVLQTRPLFDRGGVHHQFLIANSWTRKYLANAYATVLAKDGSEPSAVRRELSGTHQLNLLAFKIQHLYMKSKITNEYVTPHSAYFHPRNLYPEIKKYLI